MDTSYKKWVLNTTKEITISKMSSSDMAPSKHAGKDVANFMEEVFNKLNELVEKSFKDQV